MSTFSRQWILYILILIILPNCNFVKDQFDDNRIVKSLDETQIKNILNASGETGSSYLSGIVRSIEDNAPIVDAIVTYGGSSVRTNHKGVFLISTTTMSNDYKSFNVERSGFFSTSSTFLPNANSNSDFVTVYMRRSNLVKNTFNNTNDVTVAGNNNISVFFPSKCLVNVSGNVETDNLSLESQYFTKENADDKFIMPGTSLGIDNKPQLKGLTHIGILRLRVQGASSTMSLKSDVSMNIQLPAPTGSPAKVVLYKWNKKHAIWVYDQDINLVAGVYKADVSEITDYTIAEEYVPIPLKLKFVDENAKPISGLGVFFDALLGAPLITNNDGLVTFPTFPKFEGNNIGHVSYDDPTHRNSQFDFTINPNSLNLDNTNVQVVKMPRIDNYRTIPIRMGVSSSCAAKEEANALMEPNVLLMFDIKEEVSTQTKTLSAKTDANGLYVANVLIDHTKRYIVEFSYTHNGVKVIGKRMLLPDTYDGNNPVNLGISLACNSLQGKFIGGIPTDDYIIPFSTNLENVVKVALNISRTITYGDVKNISNLNLNFNGSSTLDFEGIEYFTSLNDNLSITNGFTSKLVNMANFPTISTSLKKFTLSYTKLNDTSFLRKLPPSVTELDLTNCEFDNRLLIALSTNQNLMNNLTVLKMGNDYSKNLTNTFGQGPTIGSSPDDYLVALSKMKSLKILDLRGNDIPSSFLPLGQLKLEELYLNNLFISELDGVDGRYFYTLIEDDKTAFLNTLKILDFSGSSRPASLSRFHKLTQLTRLYVDGSFGNVQDQERIDMVKAIPNLIGWW